MERKKEEGQRRRRKSRRRRRIGAKGPFPGYGATTPSFPKEGQYLQVVRAGERGSGRGGGGEGEEVGGPESSGRSLIGFLDESW